MGYLTKLLKQAICNAVTGRATDISVDDLNEAHEQCMWDEPGVSRLSWKWRKRSSVKIAERTYEKRAQALHC
jgi:hypothetical protein